MRQENIAQDIRAIDRIAKAGFTVGLFAVIALAYMLYWVACNAPDRAREWNQKRAPKPVSTTAIAKGDTSWHDMELVNSVYLYGMPGRSGRAYTAYAYLDIQEADGIVVSGFPLIAGIGNVISDGECHESGIETVDFSRPLNNSRVLVLTQVPNNYGVVNLRARTYTRERTQKALNHLSK